MHRLPSTLTIYRFRLAALLLAVKCLTVPLALGVLITFLITGDHALAIYGVGLVAVAVLATFLQWLVGGRTHCPLCLTPVLAKKHCRTHRHARPLFGSYRLRVALGILLRNTFYCPYCHEPTAMEVREKRRNPNGNC